MENPRRDGSRLDKRERREKEDSQPEEDEGTNAGGVKSQLEEGYATY